MGFNERGPKKDFNKARSFGGQRREFNGPKEMHKTTCSACSKDCEVPFKPTEGKPVYCRECFQKNKNF
jgi:CxxC-x17-CxxC domain-containing protein